MEQNNHEDFMEGQFDKINLLDLYGMVSLQEIQEVAETYINLKTRAAHDSVMLYQCIMNSLENTIRDKIYHHEKDYSISGTFLGTCLLKVVIDNSYVGTNANAEMIKMDSNIRKFNNDVIELLKLLEARGAKSEDLVPYLFKGYKAGQDPKFVEYSPRP
jgi:hypothetical protein